MRSRPSRFRASAYPVAIGIVVPTTAEAPSTRWSMLTRCMDPPFPRAQPVTLPYISAIMPPQVTTLRQVSCVATIGRADHVVGAQYIAHADRDRLLADCQVNRALDLIARIDTSDFLFNATNVQQGTIQPLYCAGSSIFGQISHSGRTCAASNFGLRLLFCSSAKLACHPDFCRIPRRMLRHAYPDWSAGIPKCSRNTCRVLPL